MNNNSLKKDSDQRKIFATFIMIAVLMMCVTSGTYAFLSLSATNNNVVTGNIATHTLTLSVQEQTLGGTSSGTKTNVMVPQLATALGTAMGDNYKCVDGNGNTVCKVYKITITNTSSAQAILNGTIQFTGSASTADLTNLSFARVTGATTLGSNTQVKPVQTSANAALTGTAVSKVYDLISTTGTSCTPSTVNSCSDVTLAATNGSQAYYIVVWINETGESQPDKGTWKATITFQGQDGKGITSTITS